MTGVSAATAFDEYEKIQEDSPFVLSIWMSNRSSESSQMLQSTMPRVRAAVPFGSGLTAVLETEPA
jgi:hypothetical protein